MVHHDIIAFLRSWWRPADGSWVRIAQILIGVFFVSSAIFKINNYFLIGDQSLSVHMGFWLDYNWVLPGFEPILRFMSDHGKLFALGAILFQGIPGLCLIGNWHPRKAAVFLLIVQLNIFLGTFGRRALYEFTITGVWVSLFYMFKPEDPKKWPKWLWQLMTLGLIYMAGFKLWSNYDYGFLEESVRRSYLNVYQTDVVAMHLNIKQAYIYLFVTSALAPYLWYSLWYIRLFFLGLFLTPWRNLSGIFFVLYWAGVVLTWSNAGGTEGTFRTLMFLVWLTQNQLLESSAYYHNSPGILKLCLGRLPCIWQRRA